jgi:hypothetical protein
MVFLPLAIPSSRFAEKFWLDCIIRLWREEEEDDDDSLIDCLSE